MDSVPPCIRTFVEATNRGDSDAFVAAFAPDARLDDWGREFEGHAGIREWDRTDNIGVQSHFDVLGTRQSGPETYVVTLRVTGNGYNGTGDITFAVRDGLIADVRIA